MLRLGLQFRVKLEWGLLLRGQMYPGEGGGQMTCTRIANLVSGRFGDSKSMRQHVNVDLYSVDLRTWERQPHCFMGSQVPRDVPMHVYISRFAGLNV